MNVNALQQSLDLGIDILYLHIALNDIAVLIEQEEGWNLRYII